MTQVGETSLLSEGVKSYPKALGAVNEFIRLVVSTIRDAALEELEDLSAAMGSELKEDELVEYVRPKSLGNLDPKHISLGVKVDRIGSSGWGLYFVLYWLKGEPSLSVSIWLKDTEMAGNIFTAFKKTPKNEISLDARHELYVSRAVAPDDVEQIPVILRELTEGFSDHWKKAGGLQKFLKQSGKATGK